MIKSLLICLLFGILCTSCIIVHRGETDITMTGESSATIEKDGSMTLSNDVNIPAIIDSTGKAVSPLR